MLRVVAETSESLSPTEIHARARRYYPKTGLVTVYRTLDVLIECGAVRRVHLEDGCHTVAPTSAGLRPSDAEAHSHHLICNTCRQTIEFSSCDLSALVREVRRQTGYTVGDHWLELFGLCPRCQEESP